jgi:hypothetical protein
MKYLGLPVHGKQLKNSDWDPTWEKLEKKKLGFYYGKILTLLIDTSLSSIFLHMLSFYRIPIGKRKNYDAIRSGFFWSGQDRKKYHLEKWKTVRLPKDQGGLGVIIWKS